MTHEKQKGVKIVALMGPVVLGLVDTGFTGEITFRFHRGNLSKKVVKTSTDEIILEIERYDKR